MGTSTKEILTMYPSDKLDFGNYLTDFFDRRYSRKLSTIDLAEWWDDLKNFGFDQVRNAFRDHRQDLKLGEYPPKTSNILKLLKGKEVIKKNNFTCSYKENFVECRNIGEMNIGNEDQNLYLCSQHYDVRGFKHDYQKKVLDDASLLIKSAREQGISCYDMCKQVAMKNPSSESSTKYMRTVELLSKLAGKSEVLA